MQEVARMSKAGRGRCRLLGKLRLALGEEVAAEGGGDLLFACPVCRRLLTAPVTADCGHTFCLDCLDKVASSRCAVCVADIEPCESRSVNVLVQDIVTKWCEIYDNNERDPADISGNEPRYCLRSREVRVQTDCSESYANKIARKLIIPRLKAKHRTASCANGRKRKPCSKYDLKDHFTHADISCREIKRILKSIISAKERQLRLSWQHVQSSDLECILCSRCLLDPVTTKCGHTFCRGCLARVVDHGLACPLCMASLSPFEESRGTTHVIQEAIKFLFPHDFRERLLSSRQEIKVMERSSKVPVFVCTNAYPGVACPLYVYEPRYRLLARRCLQSKTRRFAMASRADTAEKFAPFGTILEVRDAVHLRDGTSILTTVGVRRFRVIGKGEQDGYDTVTVQYIKDRTVPAERLPDLIALHQRVYSKAARWVKSLTPKVLAEVENCIGQMPALEENWYNLPDGPSWAWWLMPILPLSPKLQIGFLYTTDLEKRLRAIDKMLEHMKIKMQALKSSTLECTDTVENSDSCHFSWLLNA